MFIYDKETAKLVMSLLLRKYEGLSYDEANMLLTDAVRLIKDLGPFDPAYDYFVTQRNDMIKYMDAINWLHDLNRDEHLMKVKLIITGMRSKEIDEVEVMIPKVFTKDTRRILSDARLVALRTLVWQGKTKLQPQEMIEEAVFA